jgi:F-type H+-transporting ATPase subunit delta
MADWTHIARPYAKAVFQHALQHQALPEWSLWLSQLVHISSSPEMLGFIDNPETTVKQHEQAVCDVMHALPVMGKALPDALAAFIQVVSENRRLPVLPAIAAQYEAFRAEEENRIAVQVASFSPLSEQQKSRLVERLTKRLNRQVELVESIDPDLLGGAIISAKDWVINASVKGQLDKLAANL